MIRLLGFLLGSAIAVGAILLLLGVPNLRGSDPEIVNTIVADLKPAPDSPAVEPPPGLPQEQTAPEPIDTREPIQVPETIDESDAEISPLPEDTKFYSFWNPFRSEIAANGFVSQLEEVTGFDYRVVKIATGVYEVTFPYADEIERHSKLAQIASATGLELPDS